MIWTQFFPIFEQNESSGASKAGRAEARADGVGDVRDVRIACYREKTD